MATKAKTTKESDQLKDLENKVKKMPDGPTKTNLLRDIEVKRAKTVNK